MIIIGNFFHLKNVAKIFLPGSHQNLIAANKRFRIIKKDK